MKKQVKQLIQTDLGSDLIIHKADPLSMHLAVSPWHVGAPQCVLCFLFSKSSAIENTNSPYSSKAEKVKMMSNLTLNVPLSVFSSLHL